MPADNFIVKIYKSSFLLHFFKLLSFDIREPAHKDFFSVLEKKRGRAVNFFETLKHPSSHSRLESHQTMGGSLKAEPSFLLLASFLSLFGLPTWPLSTVSSRLCFFSTALSVHYDPRCTALTVISNYTPARFPLVATRRQLRGEFPFLENMSPPLCQAVSSREKLEMKFCYVPSSSSSTFRKTNCTRMHKFAMDLLDSVNKATVDDPKVYRRLEPTQTNFASLSL